jgi:hypothetical protein
MQTPGVFDLELYRGDTYTWQARLWDNAVDMTPIDLTGATAEAEIREKSAATPITTLDCVITLPNMVDVTLDADNWADVPAVAVWDLQLTMSDGTVRTVLRGDVKVTPDVTDSIAAPGPQTWRTQ